MLIVLRFIIECCGDADETCNTTYLCVPRAILVRRYYRLQSLIVVSCLQDDQGLCTNT